MLLNVDPVKITRKKIKKTIRMHEKGQNHEIDGVDGPGSRGILCLFISLSLRRTGGAPPALTPSGCAKKSLNSTYFKPPSDHVTRKDAIKNELISRVLGIEVTT
jgi:hypothetical protein